VYGQQCLGNWLAGEGIGRHMDGFAGDLNRLEDKF
jgi:hypothetical protein